MARGDDARNDPIADESSPGVQLRSVSLRGLGLGNVWGVSEG